MEIYRGKLYLYGFFQIFPSNRVWYRKYFLISDYFPFYLCGKLRVLPRIVSTKIWLPHHIEYFETLFEDDFRRDQEKTINLGNKQHPTAHPRQKAAPPARDTKWRRRDFHYKFVKLRVTFERSIEKFWKNSGSFVPTPRVSLHTPVWKPPLQLKIKNAGALYSL